MATVRKRTWRTAAGETKTAWSVDFTDQAGTRQRKQFSTKKAADVFRVAVEGQMQAGTYRSPAGKVTLKEVAESWLDHCEVRQKRGQRMEKATLADYTGHVRRFILAGDGVGSLKLNALAGKAIRDFRDRLLDRGVSIALTRKILSTLRLVCKHAIETELLATNPVEGVEVLADTRIKTKIKAPPKEAVTAMLAAAPSRFRAYLIVAALCGLRASEERALQWGDIDFDRGMIHVRRRADAYNDVGEPKSSAGVRDVPAGPMVLNALKQWRGARIVRPEQLVFPASVTPQPNQHRKADGAEEKTEKVQSHANVLHRDFYPLFEVLEERHEKDPGANPKVERFRWHDLRHFAISLWIEQGFNVKEVMTFAGHADFKMTMERYGHLFPKEDHQRGMAEIEGRLFGQPKKGA